MADNTHSMFINAHEAAGGYYPTPVSTAFSQLLVALAQHAEAERDIEDVDTWDPAFRAWLTDAEDAFTRVSTLITAIGNAEPIHATDVPLQRMASYVDAMIGSEEPGTFRRLHVLMPRVQAAIHCTEGSASARRVNHMLLTAGLRMDELAGLLSYEDLLPEDADDAGRELPPEACAA